MFFYEFHFLFSCLLIDAIHPICGPRAIVFQADLILFFSDIKVIFDEIMRKV